MPYRPIWSVLQWSRRPEDDDKLFAVGSLLAHPIGRDFVAGHIPGLKDALHGPRHGAVERHLRRLVLPPREQRTVLWRLRCKQPLVGRGLSCVRGPA
jgi:hypothetical protein